MSGRANGRSCAIELASRREQFPFQAPWMSEFTVEDVAQGSKQIAGYRQCGFLSSRRFGCLLLMCQKHSSDGALPMMPRAFLGDVREPLKALFADSRRSKVWPRHMSSQIGRRAIRCRPTYARCEMLAAREMHVLAIAPDPGRPLAGVESGAVRASSIGILKRRQKMARAIRRARAAEEFSKKNGRQGKRYGYRRY